MGPLIQASVGLNRIVAGHKGIEIECDLPAEPTWATIDGPKIRQVMDNLLGNAIKYSAKGTKIHVSLAAGEAGLDVTVKDHGPGIEPQELLELFEPFHRGSTAGDERGTGLGLTIARRIAEGHGGQLHITSVLGVGSIFHLRIPPGCAPVGVDPKVAGLAFAANPVLIEEDRRRLESWHAGDRPGCLHAIDTLLLALPGILADVQDAVAAGQPKGIERAAYRAGWQLRHISGAVSEAAMRLETAARAGETGSISVLWQAFETGTHDLQLSLVSFRDAAAELPRDI